MFTVDHRGTPGHGVDFDVLAEMDGLEIDDIVAAATYLAGLPEIDDARISVLGTSRGGYTALSALVREPSCWHCAVLITGLYDPTLLVAAERTAPGPSCPPIPNSSRRTSRPGFSPRNGDR
ncbi:alpha/beta hydrolase family protein [Amycolatopsis lurida]|uniref:alpha/beta hydrolase family protein n=1 Tax=Amycolatopsis lurida TaxID=31959 RepID=UPI0037ADB389